MKPLSLRIAHGTLTLRLIPAMVVLVVMAALIGLGYWQVQRLHWKVGLIADMHERMQEPAIDVGLSIILPENIPNMDYHPRRASGTFDNAHELYLNATSINGDGGYDLLTPLQLENGHTLLVNRGWMPYRMKKGDTAQESVYRPADPVTLTGILRLPTDKKPVGRPDNDVGKNDWYWVDLPAMASVTGVKEFLPFVLEAADAPHDGAWPVGGQTRVNLPNNHFHYALTWFCLAYFAPVIFLVASWRQGRPAKETPEEEKKESEKE